MTRIITLSLALALSLALLPGCSSSGSSSSTQPGAPKMKKNSKQLGIAAHVYASDNNDRVLEARGGLVQVALNPPAAAAAKSVGLIVKFQRHLHCLELSRYA